MDQEPPTDAPSANDADRTDDDARTRTLTDLLDELDRESFRRTLAVRDEHSEALVRTGRGRR